MASHDDFPHRQLRRVSIRAEVFDEGMILRIDGNSGCFIVSIVVKASAGLVCLGNEFLRRDS